MRSREWQCLAGSASPDSTGAGWSPKLKVDSESLPAASAGLSWSDSVSTKLCVYSTSWPEAVATDLASLRSADPLSGGGLHAINICARRIAPWTAQRLLRRHVGAP